MVINKNIIAPPRIKTEADKKPSIEDFESLIDRFNLGEGKTKVVEDFGNGAVPFNQIIYASPSGNILPNIGAEISRGEIRFQYDVNFYRGMNTLDGDREIIIGEPYLIGYGQRKGIIVPEGMEDEVGVKLNEDLGRNIIQAAANRYHKPILHTIQIDYHDKVKARELREKGYIPRKGYSNVFDKIFSPK